jgi:hypothetical protein
MLKFPDAISEVEGRRIARNAVFEAGREIITARSLLSEVNVVLHKVIPLGALQKVVPPP